MEQIAIVILNWNGQKFLEQFLPSVIQNSENVRLIVADNASTDSSIDFLKKNYPDIEIVINERNYGFAGGYNEALKKINSKYYLLLNSDIEVSKNWLTPLLKTIKNDNIAAVQPKIIAYHDKNKFEHAGASGGYLDKNYFPFCRGRIFDEVEEDKGQYNNETEVFWATGAALLIKSDIFHQTGGFDDSFFAHMEEIDLCWRIKKLGFQIMVNPNSVVYHVGGGTLPYQSPRKTYLNFRNSLFVIMKNHEKHLFLKLFWRMSIDGIAGIRFLTRFEFKQFLMIIKAHLNFYKNIPQLLKKRKAIKQKSSTFNKKGLYKGNILWARYFKRIHVFSELNQRLFH